MVKQDDKNVFAWSILAECYSANDDWQRAATASERALMFDPNLPQAALMLARACYQLGDMPSAYAASKRLASIAHARDVDPWSRGGVGAKLFPALRRESRARREELDAGVQWAENFIKWFEASGSNSSTSNA